MSRGNKRTTLRPQGWACGIILASVTAFASLASATSASDTKQAENEFIKGRDAFMEERVIVAAEHFERADALAPNARVLLLAIQARQAAEQLDRAATLSALALQRHPGDKKLRRLARKIVKEAKKSLGRAEVKCSEPCTLLLDGRLLPGAAATMRTVYVHPGPHGMQVSWADGDSNGESSRFRARQGRRKKIRFDSPDAQAEQELDEPAEEETSGTESEVVLDESDGPSPVLFWIASGLTGVLAGVSVVSAFDTQSNPGADAVRDGCVGQGEDCQLYQDGLASQQRTNILFGVTAGAGIATAVIGLFLTDWGAEGQPESASVSRSVRPYVVSVGDGGQIGVVTSF